MNTMTKKKYRAMIMLPVDLDEKLIEEFAQKFDSEIQRLNGSILSSSRQRHHMVKTKINRGQRGVHIIINNFEAPSQSISELNRYLRLAQNTVVNFTILSEEPLES
ncbi:MAG: 30S ribosomal protein S6 [Candidatus Caenarcaniphilales bacterium]|nr:30S ribosomal protein S6 [Candidatus Caenarcaniphilales bacterium]